MRNEIWVVCQQVAVFRHPCRAYRLFDLVSLCGKDGLWNARLCRSPGCSRQLRISRTGD